jgi:predicted dehydrogenase
VKQVAQNYRTGELAVLDVPTPRLRAGGVIVRTEYSLISAGTERMKVTESKLSLAGKARARPDQVRKVLETVSQQGLEATYRKVVNRLDQYTPLGYSLAGVIVEVGSGVDDLRVGQRVACAGDKYASHAEFNWIPKNLCVPIPDAVLTSHAAFTTVGAIAMHGFRRSGAALGETAVVIGLGLIGQTLAQILGAAGVRIVGVDVSEERCRQVREAGAVAAAPPGSEEFAGLRSELARLTDGKGADHVFLTTGTTQTEPVLLASELARDRASIVDIGKTNLDLPWNAYYEKELEVRLSRSYGPGRYDPSYEEGGVDYPIGYVRWTERRNMKAFLNLIDEARIDLEPLIAAVHPFESASEVYDRLQDGTLGGIANLFSYERPPSVDRYMATAPAIVSGARPVEGRVRVAFIGAGNYARSMLLPQLAKRDDVEMTAIATQSGLSAATVRKKFGFTAMTTEYERVLDDANVDAVIIATRHESHAAIASDALEAGKAVFLEKPPAVTPEQLDELYRTISKTGNDRLMVGYNRRFSPLLNKLKEAWGAKTGPVVAEYTITAGKLGADSWYADTARQGTRFVGEGGHFVDTLSWWIGALPIAASAVATPDDPDDLVATLTFDDGSLGVISYLTGGSSAYPKETITVTGDDRTARMVNFRVGFLYVGRKKRTFRSRPDKGQAGELDAFISAVRTGGPMPISVDSIRRTSETTFMVSRAVLAEGSGTLAEEA